MCNKRVSSEAFWSFIYLYLDGLRISLSSITHPSFPYRTIMAAADDNVINVPASTEKSSHTSIANEEVAAADRSSTPKDSDDDGEFYEDPKAARRLLIKCDIRLIPILGCLYLVSFLDRSNIANARLFKLETSLHMPSTGFNTCLWIFYLPFVIVEIPSNLFMSLNKIKPNHWLAGAMLILGMSWIMCDLRCIF